jgi:preprotein translocase subunit SecG
MHTTLIVIHLLIVLALIGVVLLQRSEGGALGIGGGGGGGGFMNSRGTGNLLTRATALLATGFFITSLLLSILAGWRPAGPTLINPATQQSPVLNPQGPSILEQLQKQQPQGPQVPQSK